MLTFLYRRQTFIKYYSSEYGKVSFIVQSKSTKAIDKLKGIKKAAPTNGCRIRDSPPPLIRREERPRGSLIC